MSPTHMPLIALLSILSGRCTAILASLVLLQPVPWSDVWPFSSLAQFIVPSVSHAIHRCMASTVNIVAATMLAAAFLAKSIASKYLTGPPDLETDRM
ncbi:hypothetical protein BDV93DRAFT_219055 [Ceratobasidium sp. AG-I]|nr:hypothetical protein BDV93DRAFT_219055 [Ceratobasidium sp. AG-I]